LEGTSKHYKANGGIKMTLKNAQLRVSALGNEIYLCTVSKRDPRIANDGKVNFTNQCISAVIQHMQGLPKGQDCYEGESGRLIWKPKKPEVTP
jgi:hypothetical protein